MRIIGDKNNINEITFVHQGRDLKFNCFIKPFPYEPRLDLEETRRTEIVFDDLLEVDNMIEMLTRFREECCEYIGYWNLKR